MNFTESIHADLASRFDDDTAIYLIDAATRIADQSLRADDDSIFDPTDPADFELIDDMIQQLIEPACTFYPLPASIADFDDLAILMMIDAILRTLIHHNIFDPAFRASLMN